MFPETAPGGSSRYLNVSSIGFIVGVFGESGNSLEW
jgi:hypothetical protein